MSTGVILLAAGAGRRFGASKPKQFMTLGEEPLFMASLRVFLSLPSVREIVVVCHPNHQPFVHRWLNQLKTKKRIGITRGGEIRGESVKNGFYALSTTHDVVLVHDSARALVTKDIVKRVELAAKKNGAALAAWPLADTLKSSTLNGRVKKTIPRAGLWLAQTPQGFKRSVAAQCLLKPSPHVTDDVELAERKGFPVTLVEGSATNFKVTYAKDLDLCRLLYR
ncbi:MAG: 2-C-methyl-D-erythritol 4-phosphate cytidylyltransferase [Elusimicrobia bacterium]|nr:2-C-methyl-D-erythritol 4-phosphate cytidylyltransferase [Elusimicrobiota bacterium]